MPHEHSPCQSVPEGSEDDECRADEEEDTGEEREESVGLR